MMLYKFFLVRFIFTGRGGVFGKLWRRGFLWRLYFEGCFLLK
jgi:hypothetical protein